MFIVAIYEKGQEYGGSEEGGWWYNTGTLMRVSRKFSSRRNAYDYASRMNRLFTYRVRGVGKKYWSAIYSGGHFEAQVYEGVAPEYYPQQRPFYE